MLNASHFCTTLWNVTSSFSKKQQSETDIVINSKSQSSVARHLGVVRFLIITYYKFSAELIDEIFKIWWTFDEVTGKKVEPFRRTTKGDMLPNSSYTGN